MVLTNRHLIRKPCIEQSSSSKLCTITVSHSKALHRTNQLLNFLYYHGISFGNPAWSWPFQQRFMLSDISFGSSTSHSEAQHLTRKPNISLGSSTSHSEALHRAGQSFLSSPVLSDNAFGNLASSRSVPPKDKHG